MRACATSGLVTNGKNHVLRRFRAVEQHHAHRG
ncbi:hypothetical protein SEEN6907_18802 [Salmonella enterica subsp. enterica serovar Newport str. VA_R100506907]|nr:hypothetical protein SEEN6907_18802 [Salmonella enterica subsp. enterica serovar Newport str. VA_R100506907]